MKATEQNFIIVTRQTQYYWKIWFWRFSLNAQTQLLLNC